LTHAFAFSLLHFRFKCFLLAFSSSQAKEKKTQKKKNHKEAKICREGKELTFKLPLYPLTFGSYFCPPAFALPFQAFFLGIFFFSSRRKDKKHKEKKTVEKKKNVEKGGSSPSSSRSILLFLAHASTLLLLPFRFKCFLLTSSSFQT
jgi:hypothetical protein